MTDDLWGELPNAIDTETPAEILKQQAALLFDRWRSQRIAASRPLRADRCELDRWDEES